MKKEPIIGAIAVLVVWAAMDFVIHGVLLSSTYEATAELWRPMAEMKMGVMYGSLILSAVCFTLLYDLGFSAATLKGSAIFGLLFGVGVGAGIGFDTYSVQPIPLMLAFSWFVTTIVEAVVAALVLHWAYRSAKTTGK